MKKIFRKNQVIITALAIMIAVAGYLNFTSDKQALDAAGKNVESDGAKGNSDDAMVSAVLEDQVTPEDFEANSELADDEVENSETEEDLAEASVDENGDPIDSDSVGEAVLTNASITLSQAKFNREQTRSKSKEMLLEIINNENLSEDAKKEAVDKMLSMTERMDKENAAEMQLAAKGFPDSIVSISDECVDVTINILELSDTRRAQIEDIVMRKTGCDLDKIVITTTKTE